ncbi:hypothetical protein DFJ77DRAFT_461573 [Powellomyces hirtus]|nr:hypothetical protein DFJ77DRAFT_461573 [Powellomyces hirtus]
MDPPPAPAGQPASPSVASATTSNEILPEPPASPENVTLWDKVSEGLTNFFYTTSGRFRPSTQSGTEPKGPITFLGVSYPNFSDPAFFEDFRSRFWMTYRKAYPPIKPSHYTSDSGWGCMLRSGQMMLANALTMHHLGRDWRLSSDEDSRLERVYIKTVSLFMDSPAAPFSIHRIALLGKQYGKNIGEWFGPTTISHVLKALVADQKEAPITVHVATDGVVYIDSVKADCAKGDAWAPVLILIPLMLGVHEMNPIYHESLKACFEFTQCTGIAGGRPNSSFFFVGTADDSVLYLDPHVLRPAVEIGDVASCKQQDFASFHCDTVKTLTLRTLDPSLVLSFFCRDRQDFDSFCAHAENAFRDRTPLFTIEEHVPDFKDRDIDIISDNDDF